MLNCRIKHKASLLVISFLLVPVLLFMRTASSSEVEAMLNEKPYFTLAFDASGGSYAITVNGMTAFAGYDGAPVSAEVPVNHLMKSGENTIAIHFVYFEDDPLGEKPNISAKLRVRHSDNSSNDSIFLSEIVYGDGGKILKPSVPQRYNSSQNMQEDDQGDIKISETVAVDRQGRPGKTITQTVYVESSLPLWAVFSSDRFFNIMPDDVPDDDYFKVADVVENELFVIYQEIHGQLKAGNVNAVVPYFEERNREFDLAFYREKGETESNLYESLMETVNDQDYEIADMNLKIVRVSFSDNAALVKMARGDRSAAIVFSLKGGGHRSYEMIFRRGNGKYILTR